MIEELWDSFRRVHKTSRSANQVTAFGFVPHRCSLQYLYITLHGWPVRQAHRLLKWMVG